MSFEIAHQIGAKGHILGIDFSPEAITANQDRLSGTQHNNIKFQTGNAETFQTQTPFDITYSRFMIDHLKQPDKAIQAMVNATQKGGKIVIEDVDVSEMTASVNYPALNKLKTLLIQLVQNNGGNATRGTQLTSLVQQAHGISHPLTYTHSHQPKGSTGAIKRVPLNILNSISDKLLENHMLTPPELKNLQQDLEQLAKDTSITVSFPKIYQVIAEKN